jgi:hypothetical protein
MYAWRGRELRSGCVTILASKQCIEDWIADVINAVQKHYLDSGTAFGVAARHNGALVLLYLLGDGLKERAAREERVQQLNGVQEEI